MGQTERLPAPLVEPGSSEYTRTDMLRFATPFAALLLIASLSACKVNTMSTTGTVTPASTSATPVLATASPALSPPAQPTGSVPDTARPVEQTTTLGQITRQAKQTPQTTGLRKLLDAFCQDGLMIIQTSQETIYADLPCDRFWDDQAKQDFLNKQVAILLEVTPQRSRVILDTLDGAHTEFTVNGIWVR
jgi:hypothetical protein